MMHRYQGNYHNHQLDRHHNHLRSRLHLRQQHHILDSNNNILQQQHFPCSRLPSMVYNNSILLQQQQHNHHMNSLTTTTPYQQPTNTSNKAPATNNCYEQKCLCCPYGFHIDLDFVRYMESLRRDVSARNQSPLRVKAMTNRDRLKLSSKERSAFSEDESTFVLRNYTLEERRPDSACANLSCPSRPYVVKPKAEPDVLVAIPDELKTLRTELFLDPEIEKKFRASTQLFIDNKNQQQRQEQSNKFVEVDTAYNSGSSGDVVAKLRQTTEQRQPSGLPPSTRYRSSISVVIEQLEQCLGASSLNPVSSKFDQINNSSHSEREEDANQLTKVQTLCSKIISKLRRLHELEDRVRLIPDLDDHILSLTRQLDQLKMRQHQQNLGADEPSTKARRCVTTRDVGVGNAVLLPRSPTGFSTTTPSSIKKFADISASSLPPQPPPSSSTSKKVREVSIQVTPPNVAQNINKTSEKKLYMNHGSNNSNDIMKADNKNLSEGDHKFCCTKCGSTEVAKLQSDVENIERGVMKIIRSVDRPFQPFRISRETIATHDGPESMRNVKKIPPVVAPKPKVFQKSLVDPDVIHVGRQNGVHLLEDGLKFYEVKDKSRGDFKTSIECDEAVDETRLCQPNVWIDNHQTFLNKSSITTSTKESSQTTRSLMVCQSSGKVFTVEVTPPSVSSVVPVVIDLLESSSESEEMEKESMVELKSEGQVISVQSLTDSLSKVHSGIVQRSSTTQHPTMVNYSSECLISEITIEENFDGDGGGSSDDTLLAEPLACDMIFKNVETSSDICDLTTDVSKQDAWMALVANRILEEAREEAASICIDLPVIPETTASQPEPFTSQRLQSTEAVFLTHGDHRDPLESLTSASYELSRYERESDEKIKQTQVKSSFIPATPPSSPSLSSSSSSSSFPLKSFSSSHAPIVPNSSLATLEDHNQTMEDDHVSLMLSNTSDISIEVKKNLFAETLTTDVLLTTTSESSEAENWNESHGIDRSPDKDSAILFANSHKLFLEAAAGKKGALSDPGDLWKNKSISSELTATMNTTTDDDDYCSSSSAAEVVVSKKSRLLDSDELSAIQEDKTSGSSLGTTEEQTPSSVMDAKIYSSPDSTITLRESLLSSKATASDTIVVTLRSQDKTISFVKVRPNSSGAFESESPEFMPLESSAITSQSLDAGINEELATIRNPCKLVLLKNEVPTIKINFVPSLSGAATPLSLGLSSDLSIFEDEEPCADDDDDDDDADDDVNADDVEGGDDDDDEEFKSSTETTDVAETSVAMTTTAEEIGTTGACSLTAGDDGFNLRMIPEDEEDCFLEACVIYANWLTDPTSITDSEKEAIVELIRKDWFLTSGRKMSQGSEVRSALLTMRNFGDLFVESVVNMADADGNTTLHYAVSHGNGPVIEALLEVGLCDVDKQNNAGYTPVMLSALLIEDVPRNFELLKTLFEFGDINAASDRSGQTALMLASSHGREEMVGLLLECGSDVNIQDEDGSTALMCASEHGHVDIIKMLLAHPDCNSSLADIDGSTALSIAMEEGNHDIGILIYAHMKVHGAIEDEDQEPSV